jgi:hypothetical protein
MVSPYLLNQIQIQISQNLDHSLDTLIHISIPTFIRELVVLSSHNNRPVDAAAVNVAVGV